MKKLDIRIRLSPLTLGLALYIVLSAFLMRQTLQWLEGTLGSRGIAWLLWVGLALGAGAGAFHLRSSRPGPVRICAFFLVLAAGFLFAASMKVVAERIHLIQFGLLGWLAVRDTDAPKNTRLRLFPAIFFCLAVGAIDEICQFYYPLRVGDVRDILFAGGGGLWGAAAFLLAETGNPGPGAGGDEIGDNGREELPQAAADGAEGKAVEGGGPVAVEGGEMLPGPVALVAGETVSGVAPVGFDHYPVPGHLGDDRGGGDGDANIFSPNQASLPRRQAGERDGVD